MDSPSRVVVLLMSQNLLSETRAVTIDASRAVREHNMVLTATISFFENPEVQNQDAAYDCRQNQVDEPYSI